MRPGKMFGVALMGALVLAACSDSDPGAGPEPTGATSSPSESPAAEGPTAEETKEPASGAITYTGVDFGFEGPSELAAGEVEITLENAGEEQHQILLFPVIEGTTVDDVTAYLEENPNADDIPEFVLAEPVETFARPGRVSRRPIETTVEPGTYMMACFIPSPANEHMPHALLGMVMEITVV